MKTALSLLLAALFSPSISAQSFAGVADGFSVVPTTTSQASAVISATLRATASGPQLDYAIAVDGLDLDGNQTPNPFDDVTAVHLHRGPAGSNGPHVLNVFGMPSQDDAQLVVDPVAGLITGTWDDTDQKFNPNVPPASSVALTDALAELASCGLYVQIHSMAVPSGEIRGQIRPRFQFRLEGAQVAPPTASSAGGLATLTLRATPAGAVLDYEIALDGLDLDGNQTPDPLDDVTGVHLHLGAPGADGAHVLNVFGAPSLDDSQLVVVPLAGTLTGTWDDGDASVNPSAPLNQSTIALSDALFDLVHGNLYVEVETAGLTDGEVRGQVVAGLPLPGTNEAFRLLTGIGGPPATGPCDTAKRATGGDVLAIELDAPGGELAGAVPLLLAQVYPSNLLPVTGPIAFPAIPEVQLDPSQALFVFDGFTAGGPFGQTTVGDGISLSFTVLNGLGGLSLRLQAGAFSPLAVNGIAAISEAHDIVLE